LRQRLRKSAICHLATKSFGAAAMGFAGCRWSRAVLRLTMGPKNFPCICELRHGALSPLELIVRSRINPRDAAMTTHANTRRTRCTLALALALVGALSLAGAIVGNSSAKGGRQEAAAVSGGPGVDITTAFMLVAGK
jgi:hypothetical protein